ncbi:iron complex outermembrane receptor protein [Sphaerotilus hippei]|uniref:Iron complex outermembrane receptor protein n=1 Tax=Sphaerotilus hippei TaxID=744406 RepID=A0A318H5T2_9BURK|nr:TonB-dependent receptor [Sphaerotilus hippei]PXW98827.1 iron complex outermembrane receptor protein [Sphaerotilus hippei]
MTDSSSRLPVRRAIALACSLTLCGLTLPAVAQSGAPPAAEAPALDGVIVSGSARARRQAEAPYAISQVGSTELRDSGPMLNLSESLARVPGLNVANRNNYAQDLQISSRGFGARAGFGVRGLRLYSDGIPASMPDGQGQVGHMDLAGADRVEVLRGPFSALYGNSSGGVIALFSRPVRQAEAELALDRGSDGLSQWRARVATPLGQGMDLSASLGDTHLDGSRAQSEARRSLVNLRLGWRGEQDRLTLTYSDQQQRADDPLGLDRSQLNQDPEQTTSQARLYDTRKFIRQDQVGASWEHDLADGGALSELRVAAYAGTRGVMQSQAIAPSTQANARHGGGLVDFDRSYHGIDGRLLWRWSAVDLVTGLNVERQKDDRQGYENYTGTGTAQVLGVQGRLRRDELNTALTQEAYAQAEWRLAPAWRASAGVRTGVVGMEVEDRYLANGNDSGSRDFRYTSPVLGLSWQPAREVTLHGAFSRGHETPTLGELAYRSDGTGGLNTELQAQTSRQIELGAKWRQADWALDATVFRIRTDDEIGVATNSGGRASYRNVGRTRRDGAELGATWQALPGLKAQVALTWLRARYADDFLVCAGIPCSAPTVPVAAGNQIAGTQDRSAYAELAWTPAWSARAQAAIEWRGQGRTAVNDTNSDFADGYGLVNLRYRQRFALDRDGDIEVLARIDNLADRRVVGSVIVNDANGRYFEPATGRSALLSLRYLRRL